MKGHKAHHHAHKAHKSHGGHMDSPKHGDKVHDKNPTEIYAGKGSHVVHEADERKHGGRTKKHHAHHAHHEHHEHAHHMHPAKKHKKHVGHAEGEEMKHHAGRKPRKSGGRTGSNMNPLSSAHHGEKPTGRKGLEMN